MLIHPIPPVWRGDSRVLILGSFPSARSREERFYYGHPQNRFWRVLAALWEEDVPLGIEARREFLLRHRIALWDVIASCEITGSADSTIRHAVPNDLRPILQGAPICAIFTGGGTASSLYKKYPADIAGEIPHIALPSTSPANAAWSAERLCEAWQIVREMADRAP